MFYKGRELRRVWEVEVYEGDPEDPDVTTRTETVIAWNQVEAIRRAGGKVATLPVSKGFVTWPQGQEKRLFRIENTAGPTDEVVEPTLSIGADDE
jgi:hypothetical protein